MVTKRAGMIASCKAIALLSMLNLLNFTMCVYVRRLLGAHIVNLLKMLNLNQNVWNWGFANSTRLLNLL
jgi:hypothetical protein